MHNITEDGVFVLIKNSDGDLLEWQCGGYACDHRSAIGNITKVADSNTEKKLLHHFYGSNGYYGGWCCDEINSETKHFIEGLISGFTVDDILTRSCEAWVEGYYKGEPAVLFWENSD